LRAGLLSDPEVIHLLNSRFVCTSTIIDDVQKRASSSQEGNELAKKLEAQWEYPVEMMFLTPTGTVVSKLNSYKDFPGVHPDVVAPPKKQHVQREGERSHTDIFLKHIAKHFSM
jgi:hypothetical protein